MTSAEAKIKVLLRTQGVNNKISNYAPIHVHVPSEWLIHSAYVIVHKQ